MNVAIETNTTIKINGMLQCQVMNTKAKNHVHASKIIRYIASEIEFKNAPLVNEITILLLKHIFICIPFIFYKCLPTQEIGYIKQPKNCSFFRVKPRIKSAI